MFVLNKSFVICTMLKSDRSVFEKCFRSESIRLDSTGHFVLHDFLSTRMIIFFMLVDTLFTQCAFKCKKCATQIMS